MKRQSIKALVVLSVIAMLMGPFSGARQRVQAAASNYALVLEESTRDPGPFAEGRVSRFRISGKVYDAITRQGIAGASVSYNNCYSHPMIYPTRVDGSYEIGWTVYLMCINSFEVSAPGYQTLVQPVTFWKLLMSPRRDFYLMPGVTLPPTPTPTPYVSLTPTPYEWPTSTPYATSTPTPYEWPTPTPLWPTPTPLWPTPTPLWPTPTPLWPTPTPYEWPTPTPYASLTPTPYEWPTPTHSPTPYDPVTPTPTPTVCGFYGC